MEPHIVRRREAGGIRVRCRTCGWEREELSRTRVDANYWVNVHFEECPREFVAPAPDPSPAPSPLPAPRPSAAPPAPEPEERWRLRLRMITSWNTGIPDRARFTFCPDDSGVTLACQRPRAEKHIPYAELRAVEVGAPGRSKSPTFFGGGFGVVGAAEGMLAAQALQVLTSRRRSVTVIRVVADRAELIARMDASPPQVRTWLAPVLRRLKTTGSPPASPRPHGREVDIPDAIRQLAALRDDGLLTEAEFEAKKQDLLRRL